MIFAFADMRIYLTYDVVSCFVRTVIKMMVVVVEVNNEESRQKIGIFRVI